MLQNLSCDLRLENSIFDRTLRTVGVDQAINGPRAMDTHMKKAFSVSLVVLFLSGCQVGGLPGMSGLGQPGRVPPPGTGSYQVPGSYSGSSSPSVGAPTAGAATVGASSPSPLVDQVASAQNQLKQATDNARAAVMQTTQSFQSQVEQAGARADKLGAGVVQASKILNDAATGALPTPPVVTPGTLGSPSGSLSDRDGGIATDPNAQWRKPVPR